MRVCGCHRRQPRRPGRLRRSPAPSRSSGTPRAVAQTTPLQGQFAHKPTANSLSYARGLRQGREATGKRPPSGPEAGAAAPLTAQEPPGGRTQVTLSSFANISENTHAPQDEGGRVPAGRALPDFSLIRRRSSLVHLNEELRASGRSEAGAQGVTRERRPRS